MATIRISAAQIPPAANGNQAFDSPTFLLPAEFQRSFPLLSGNTGEAGAGVGPWLEVEGSCSGRLDPSW